MPAKNMNMGNICEKKIIKYRLLIKHTCHVAKNLSRETILCGMTYLLHNIEQSVGKVIMGRTYKYKSNIKWKQIMATKGKVKIHSEGCKLRIQQCINW